MGGKENKEWGQGGTTEQEVTTKFSLVRNSLLIIWYLGLQNRVQR